MPAAALEVTAPMPAEMAPPAAAEPAAVAAPPAARPAPPAATLPPPAAAEPAAAPLPKASLASPSFLTITSAPTGNTAASALEVLRSSRAERAAALAGLQVAADRRRALGEALGDLPELQADLLAGEQAGLRSLGQANPGAHEQRLHARHGGVHGLGDLVVGERVDLAHAAARCAGSPGRSWTSATICRNSSRRCTVSAVVAPLSRSKMSIESWPAARGLRRWFRQRLRAIRYSHGPER